MPQQQLQQHHAEENETIVQSTVAPDQHEHLWWQAQKSGSNSNNSIPLIGREYPQHVLEQALQRCCSNQKQQEAVFIYGPSGTGKTALLTNLRTATGRRQHLQSTTGRGSSQSTIFWFHGKFEQPTTTSAPSQQQQPYSALIQAISSGMSQIQQSDYADEISYGLEMVFTREDWELLSWILPCIITDLVQATYLRHEVLEAMRSEEEAEQQEYEEERANSSVVAPRRPAWMHAYAFRLFNKLFQRLLLILSSERHPVVLILEDLQWADPESQQLLEAIWGSSKAKRSGGKHGAGSVSSASVCSGYTSVGSRPQNSNILSNVLLLGSIRTPDTEQHKENSPPTPSFDLAPSVPFLSSNDSNDGDHSHHSDPSLAFTTATLTQSHKLLLGPLSPAILNAGIATAMRMPQSESEALSTIVHQRTGGNPQFVIQFMDLLAEQGLIRTGTVHSPERASQQVQHKNRQQRLQWNVEEIQESTMLMDNVVDLYIQKISSLPAPVQWTLAVASVLGFSFSVSLLEHILQNKKQNQEPMSSKVLDLLVLLGQLTSSSGEEEQTPEVDVLTCLRKARSVGLVEKVATTKGGALTVTRRQIHYKFTHDRVQQSASALLRSPQSNGIDQPPSCDTIGSRIQGLIGELLLELASSTQHELPEVDSTIIFSAAQLLLHNKSSLTSMEIAHVCLTAAQQASQKGAYRYAASLADAGIARLDQRSAWASRKQEEYNLILDLHVLSIEMYESCGSAKEVEELSGIVERQIRCPADGYRMWESMIQTRMGREEWDLALAKCRYILNLFGDNIPVHTGKIAVLMQFARSRRLLKGRTPEELEKELPRLQDKAEERRCLTLSAVAFTAHVTGDQNLCAVACHKLFQSTLTHGIGKNSPFAMIGYASTLAVVGKLESAFAFGSLAMRLCENQKDPASLCRSISPFHNLLAFISHPLVDGLEEAKRGFEAGMKVGNLLSSAYCLRLRVVIGSVVGQSLYEFARYVHEEVFQQRSKYSVI